MLTNARVLGYVFNPLTVYWCHEAGRRAGAASIAEVHNTYGGRHRYLLRTDDAGPRRDRQGVLRLTVLRGRRPLHDEPAGARRAAGAARSPCTRPRARTFVASVTRPAPPRPRAASGAAAARPSLVDAAGVARIRWQGIKLYLRGLPVIPRRSLHRHSRGTADHLHRSATMLQRASLDASDSSSSSPPIAEPAAPPSTPPAGPMWPPCPDGRLRAAGRQAALRRASLHRLATAGPAARRAGSSAAGASAIPS